MLRRMRTLLVLALVLSALIVVTPAPAALAATNVTIRVTIKQIIADDSFDSTSSADFYGRVTINGTEQFTPVVDGEDSPSPNWQIDQVVDWDVLATVPIHISIWDDDGFLNFGDDHADISPDTSKSDLDLTLHLTKVPCFVDGDVFVNDNPDSPRTSANCGQELTAIGQGNNAGDGEARIIYQVDVINNALDTDGDGIPDSWEQNGTTIDGQFINLPAMGADPNKADIFIHIDWMQQAGICNQQLSQAALQQVVTAFANSPYVAINGATGINMHIDEGANSVGMGTAPTIARAIPCQTNLGTLDGSGNYVWTQFQGLKSTFFEPTGRSPIFHYVIAGIFQEPPPPCPCPPGGVQNTSSGISRNQTDFNSGASDLLLTLGNFGAGAGTQQQQAGTLMHELGHNLGLHHGGNVDTNYKPNYESIMNYLYQFRGLDVGGVAGVLNYSTGPLGPVNEGALNESNALGVPGIGTGSRCPVPGGGFTNQYTVNANAPFDWNCNGTPTDGVVSFDANSNGGIDGSLTDYNDWANIKLRTGLIGELGAGNEPTTSPTEPEIPWDQIAPTTTAQVIPTPTVWGWNNSSVTVQLHATDNAGGFGVRDITYSASGAQTIASTNVLGDTANVVISNEGVTTITFHARDQALNVESDKTQVVSIDLTDPEISLGTAYPAPNAAGWNNTDVNVPFTATDVPSGIDYTVPAASPLVLSAEGTAVTGTVTAVDKAGNMTTVTTPAFMIDKTPPVITVTSPTPNQVFDSDQTMTPVFGATDALSGVKSVVATLDTGQVVTSGTSISLGLLVGHRTLTVVATDVADNVATTVVPFRVRPVFVGNAYDDANSSAMRESGEAGLAGVTVFLDNNGNGKLDAGEPSIVTDAAGAYRVVGEDVGPARLCTLPIAADRVRTTSRCQTVVVATGIPVPRTDFGSKHDKPGSANGTVADVIQSIALAGQTDQYWRPAALAGTADGPWAGSRLIVSSGGNAPVVQVQAGERVAAGIFVGGVNASQVTNLALSVQYLSNRQTLVAVVAVVAADGSVAVPASGPSTTFSYAQNGNVLTIYGVPQDGLGGYQDVWLITQVTAGNGQITTVAGIAGTVVTQNGKTSVKSLGGTTSDQSQSNLISGVSGTLTGALLVDDIPSKGGATNPF